MTFPLYEASKPYLEQAGNNTLPEAQRHEALCLALEYLTDSITQGEKCVDAANKITDLLYADPHDRLINRFFEKLHIFIIHKRAEDTTWCAQHAIRIVAIYRINYCEFKDAVENLSILFSSCRHDLDLMILHYLYYQHEASRVFFKPCIQNKVQELSVKMKIGTKLQLEDNFYVDPILQSFFSGYSQQCSNFINSLQNGIKIYWQQIQQQEELALTKPSVCYTHVWIIYHLLGLCVASDDKILANKINAYTFYELPSLYNYPIAKHSASKLFEKNPLPDEEQFGLVVSEQQTPLPTRSVNSSLPGEWAYLQGVYEFKKTNYKEAKNYFLYASEQGYLAADLWLSTQYGSLMLSDDAFLNLHDDKLDSQSFDWFEKNFRPNYIAIFNLFLLGKVCLNHTSKHFSDWVYGFMFQHGFRCNPINVSRAFNFFTNAANSKSKEAWYALGWMNELGIGCARNQEEANKFFTKAANGGLAEAQNKLGDDQLKLGQQKYKAEPSNPSERIENFKSADKWYLRALEQGFAAARFTYYWRRQDLFNSITEIVKSANQSLMAAEAFLAREYRSRREDIDIKEIFFESDSAIRSNFALEFRYTRRAAEKNHSLEQYRLAYLYLEANIDQDGNLLPKPAEHSKLEIEQKRQAAKELGWQWMGKSVAVGNKGAQACLGQKYYRDGKYDTAYFWLKHAISGFNAINREGIKTINEMLEDIEKRLSTSMGDAQFKNFQAVVLNHVAKDTTKVEELLEEAAKSNLVARVNLMHVRGLPILGTGIGSIQGEDANL